MLNKSRIILQKNNAIGILNDGQWLNSNKEYIAHRIEFTKPTKENNLQY